MADSENEDDNVAAAASRDRVAIIQAVQTPLGFFTLGVLVVETVMGALIPVAKGDHRLLLIFGMIGLLSVLFLFVAWIVVQRPEWLQARAGNVLDPEQAEMLEYLDVQCRVADELSGNWRYVTEIQSGSPDELGAPPASGTCVMRRDGPRLEIEGEWRDHSDAPTGNWSAKQVFVGENELTYLFEVQEKPGVASLGVTQVRLYRDAGGGVEGLSGVWGVLGRDAYGSIRFTPAPEAPAGEPAAG